MTTTEQQPIRTRPSGEGQLVLRMLERIRGGNGVMNVPVTYRMEGAVNPAALADAFERLVERHESLRSAFRLAERKLWQDVLPPYRPELVEHDLRDEPDPESAARLAMRERITATIDVASGRPFTIDLYRLSETGYTLLINLHHLVTDAWSNMLICRDLGAYYNEAAGGAPAVLPEIDWQYTEFLDWHDRHDAGSAGDVHRRFLERTLTDVPYLDLRPMPKRKAFAAPAAGNAWFALDPENVDQLRKLGESERTSLFVVVLSLFYGVLHLESGKHDIALGSIMANRPRPELACTVGAFANMAVLRARIPERPTARDVLRATRTATLDSLPHQGVSFHRLAGDTGLATARAIGEVVFHMLAVPPGVATPNGVVFDGLEVTSQHIPDGMGTRFDLELLVFPQPAGLEAVLRYAADRYDTAFVDELAARYLALATVAAEQPDVPLADVDFAALAARPQSSQEEK